MKLLVTLARIGSASLSVAGTDSCHNVCEAAGLALKIGQKTPASTRVGGPVTNGWHRPLFAGRIATGQPVVDAWSDVFSRQNFMSKRMFTI